MLKTDVTHLMLFEGRFNVREYDIFLSKIGYQSNETFHYDSFPSHSTLTLLCNDIEHICRNNLAMRWLDNVTKLTYFGGSSEQLNWHAVLRYLIKELIKYSKLDTLVLHRYGYYQPGNFLKDDAKLYSSQKTIHLVQPSLKQKTSFTNNEVSIHYTFAGGFQNENGTVTKIEPSVQPESNKTQVYVHHLLPYGDEHYEDSPPENFPHEPYE